MKAFKAFINEMKTLDPKLGHKRLLRFITEPEMTQADWDEDDGDPDFEEERLELLTGYVNVDDILEHYGFHRVGSGEWGITYENKNYPWMLKFFNRQDMGYRNWVTYSLRHPQNPYVPKFKGQIINISDFVAAIRVEKLFEPNITEAEKLVAIINMVHPLYRADVKARRIKADPTDADLNVYFGKDMKWLKQMSGFIFAPGAMDDLSWRNIMQRKNGQLVIIDPIAGQVWKKFPQWNRFVGQYVNHEKPALMSIYGKSLK